MASGSDMAEALNALLENVKMPLSQMEQNIQALFAKRGAGKGKDGDDIPWQVIASEVGKGPAAIKATLSAIKSYIKAKEEIEKLLKKVSDNSEYKRGSGALSNEQVYYRTGWKLTKGGFQWTRPRNSPYSENVPSPSVPRHRADYAGIGEIDDALAGTSLGEFARSNVHPTSGFFPATMEDVVRFRREERRVAESRRFRTMMDRDLRTPLSVGDDSLQYAFGADTGVGSDFDYLRREEAEQSARRSRYSRIRHGQQAARMRLDMSDYDLFIHENKAKYGGREYAEEAYRKMLLKNMPAFFKDSKLSTKALIDIKKLYDGAKGIPILGPMARMAMAHPTVAAGAGVLGAIQYTFGQSDKANTTVVKWQNAMNLYGKPSKEFMNAAMLAGMTDVGQISKIYGELTARYGDADMFIKNIGSAMANMPPIARIAMAKSLGLDDTTMALVDIMSGNKHLDVNEARRVQAYKTVAETQKTIGWTSGSGASATAQSLWYSMPGMTSGAARDMENLDYIRKGATENLYEIIDENVDKTREAAESLDEAEKNGIQTTNNATTTNESHAVYIAKVELSADNPEEFISMLEQRYGGSSGRDNRAVLAAMGSGFLA